MRLVACNTRDCRRRATCFTVLEFFAGTSRQVGHVQHSMRDANRIANKLEHAHAVIAHCPTCQSICARKGCMRHAV